MGKFGSSAIKKTGSAGRLKYRTPWGKKKAPEKLMKDNQAKEAEMVWAASQYKGRKHSLVLEVPSVFSKAQTE